MSSSEQTRSPRRIRWVRILVAVVVVAAVAATAVVVLPEALKPRANGVACSDFRREYDRYVTAIAGARSTGDQTTLAATRAGLPARVRAAATAARGQVRTALLVTATAADAHLANPRDQGAALAFFASAIPVQQACAADGSTIRLKRLG